MPQPEGPISAVIRFRGMSIVMSRSASDDPYQTERPLVASTTGLAASTGRAGGAGARASEMLMGGSASGGSGVTVPDHDGRGVHREQQGQEQEDAAGGDRLEVERRAWRAAGQLGVVVDLRPAGRCTGSRAPWAGSGSSRPRRPSAAGPSRRSPARAPGSPRSGCPASPRAGRGRGPPAIAIAPSAIAAWRSESGTVRRASWVAITITGRISRPSVSAAGPERRPQRQPLHAEGPDEDRQAEQAVDDRRHARQVGDVQLDDPPEPAGRGVFLEEDRRADADRDREGGHQPEQPERPGDPRPEAGQGRGARPDRVHEVPENRQRTTRRATPDRPSRPPRPAGPTSTTTPLRVARRQASPNSGPRNRRLRPPARSGEDRPRGSFVDLAKAAEHEQSTGG